MAQRVTTLACAFCLPVLSTIAAFPQTSPDATSNATPTASRVSDVYVGTANGVYLYHVAANGSVSMVSGSPYHVGGTAIGSNHKFFFSQDPNYLHAYPVASNGAIKAQVSQINTQNYSGSECGTVSSALLDHTGQDVYSQLSGDPNGGYDGPCEALQSFKVSSTGAFTFLGGTEFESQTLDGIGGFAEPVKLSGNGNYAYSASFDEECDVRTWKLKRESSGAMMFQTWEFLSAPSTPPDWRWYPFFYTSDPANHMAVAMWGESGDFGPCGEQVYRTQLASYTIGSDGTLTTTNTPDKMPTPQVNPRVLYMDSSGKFLAVGGNTTNNTGTNGTQTPGLQVFHFNGANPITPYSKVLTTSPIDGIRWDQNDHLFALSNSTHKLFVYSVTSSAITAAPGSPYTIPAAPNALTVVPAVCSAPASDGVHICAPAGGSTVSSPVLVAASAKVTGSIARMELWIDGVKKYTANSAQLNTTVSLAAGKHHFGVFAINTAGQKWQNAVDATVK